MMTPKPADGMVPEVKAPVPELAQLGLGLVETPAGQRVALTMTMLLPAGDGCSGLPHRRPDR